MKTLFRVLLLSLLSFSAFAQTEKSANDTTTTSQTTRADIKYMSGVPFRVQKGVQPRRLGFFDEIVAATNGGVQQVNGKVPTSGNVVITTNDVAENVKLYYTDARARLALSAGGAINYNNATGVFTFTQPAISGDGTIASGGSTFTLANVNSNVGTFGSTNSVGALTVNAKGQVTGASNITITPGGIGAAAAATTIPFTPVTNYSGLAGITPPTGNNLVFAIVGTDATYSDTGTLYVIYSSGKIRKVSLLPSEN